VRGVSVYAAVAELDGDRVVGDFIGDDAGVFVVVSVRLHEHGLGALPFRNAALPDSTVRLSVC